MSDFFGYDTYGPGSRTVRNKIYGTKFELSYVGRVKPESIFVYSEFGSTNNWKCAIYDENFNFIAETEQRLIGWGNWYEFEIITSNVKLTGVANYYLVAWSDNNEAGGYVVGPGYSVGIGVYQDLTFGSFPDPLIPTIHDRIVSIYCTYQPIVKSRIVKSS